MNLIEGDSFASDWIKMTQDLTNRKPLCYWYRLEYIYHMTSPITWTTFLIVLLNKPSSCEEGSSNSFCEEENTEMK